MLSYLASLPSRINSTSLDRRNPQTSGDSASSAKHPVLLCLPRELRDYIWKLAVLTPSSNNDRSQDPGSRWIDACDFEHAWISDYANDEEQMRRVYTHRPPPLLATSRQIRSEAGEIYYHQSRFLFSQLGVCASWLGSLEHRWVEELRFLTYCGCHAPSIERRRSRGEVRAFFEGVNLGEVRMKGALWYCEARGEGGVGHGGVVHRRIRVWDE